MQKEIKFSRIRNSVAGHGFLPASQNVSGWMRSQKIWESVRWQRMAEDMNEKVNMSARAHKGPKRCCLLAKPEWVGRFEQFLMTMGRFDSYPKSWETATFLCFSTNRLMPHFGSFSTRRHVLPRLNSPTAAFAALWGATGTSTSWTQPPRSSLMGPWQVLSFVERMFRCSDP